MRQSAVDITAPLAAASELEASTIRAISWRLIPFLVLAYFLSYLDRVNLGFAALTMNKELNFSPTIFSKVAEQVHAATSSPQITFVRNSSSSASSPPETTAPTSKT